MPTESKGGKVVTAQPAPVVDTIRPSQDVGQLERALERERKDRQEAERVANLERKRRGEREADLERVQKQADLARAQKEADLARVQKEARLARLQKEKEIAARRVDVEPSKGQFASQQSQVESFGGIHGTVRIMWQHEGVIYRALVVTNGATGSAMVNYIDPRTGMQIGAYQDLEFIRNANGAFYVGSNARIPGTAIPHPMYAPDILRLSLRDGNWAIAEVSPDGHHFDRVAISQAQNDD